MQRRSYGLRVTFSLFCGMLCVLLVVLWVRSHWWWDGAMGRLGSFASSYTGLTLCVFNQPGPPLTYSSVRNSVLLDDGAKFVPTGWHGFALYRTPQGLVAGLPYWFAIVATVSIGLIPWLPWFDRRFSLRTLLVAISLVAVGLGAFVRSLR